MRWSYLRLKRRVGSFVTRRLALALDAVRAPFDPYPLVGVPLRTVEIAGRPVVPPEAVPRGRPSPAERPSGLDLDRPVLRRKFGAPPPPAAALELFELAHGVADSKGLVLSSDGRLVNPAALDQARYLREWSHQVYGVRPTSLDGPVVTLAHGYDGNLFHWLFEQLPKLALIDALPEPKLEPAPRLYLAQRHGFQRESLALFGIDADQVVASHRATAIRAERLYAFSYWSAFDSVPAWACDFLRARARLPAGPSGAERIYVSRADARGRRLANEPALVDRLARFGFRRIVLSEHSLAEQAALFRGAAVVVGPHGAGLSNAVFCRPGAWLVELSAPRYVFGCWHDLAAKCDLDYSFVPAIDTDFDTDHGWRHQREDFAVDVDAVAALLARGIG